MNRRKFIFILPLVILMFSISINAYADDNTTSQYTLPYMRMGLGARALGMGSAFTAISDNISATYWNPAGLANIKGIELGSMYSANMGLDRTYNYAGIAKGFGFGTFAISWINAGWSDFQGAEGGVSTGTFNLNDHNVTVSYGTKLLKVLKIGCSAKAYLQDIDNESESGFGFDAGLLYELHPQFSLGLMMRDFVSSFGDDDLPYQANVGFAVKPFNFYKKHLAFLNDITIAGDIRKEQDESDVNIGLGLDLAFGWKAISDLDVITSLRFGSNDANFTTGFGILFKMIEFNYAFTTDTSEDKIFEDSHRLSLIVRF